MTEEEEGVKVDGRSLWRVEVTYFIVVSNYLYIPLVVSTYIVLQSLLLLRLSLCPHPPRACHPTTGNILKLDTTRSRTKIGYSPKSCRNFPTHPETR